MLYKLIHRDGTITLYKTDFNNDQEIFSQIQKIVRKENEEADFTEPLARIEVVKDSDTNIEGSVNEENNK